MAEQIEVWIPTTETLTYDRLEHLAEASLAPSWEPSCPADDEIDGIVFDVIDQKAADFWIARGALWGHPDYPNFIPTEEHTDA